MANLDERLTMSIYRECAYLRCSAPTVEQLNVPLCAKHCREVFFAVRGLMDQADWVTKSASARATGTARPRRNQQVGTIYFARVGELVKIGFSTSLEQRLQRIHADELLATQPGTMHDEKSLHMRFGSAWVTGEYFRPTDEVMSYIDGIQTAA